MDHTLSLDLCIKGLISKFYVPARRKQQNQQRCHEYVDAGRWYGVHTVARENAKISHWANSL